MRWAPICSLLFVSGVAVAARGVDSLPPATTSVETKPTDADALLKEKIAELERLQAEIRALRQTAGRDQPIRVDMKIYELSLTKLQRLGLDLAELGIDPTAVDRPKSMRGNAATVNTPLWVGSAPATAASGLVEILRRKELLKDLPTAPSQIAADGRTIYFLSGASGFGGKQVPSSLAGLLLFDALGRKLGIQVDMTPTRVGDRQIRLNIRAKASEVDRTVSITLNGATLPGIRVQEIVAPCEMELGATAILAGLIQSDPHVVVDAETGEESEVADDTLILLLATPELVNAAAR